MLKRTFYGESSENPTNLFLMYGTCRWRFIVNETSFRLEFLSHIFGYISIYLIGVSRTADLQVLSRFFYALTIFSTQDGSLALSSKIVLQFFAREYF